MNKILAIAAIAASTFVAQAAQAAFICATDVNVRNHHGVVFSSAQYGENVTRTGQSQYFWTESGYRAFTRVYFNQYPQGYGWVANEYVCGY